VDMGRSESGFDLVVYVALKRIGTTSNATKCELRGWDLNPQPTD